MWSNDDCPDLDPVRILLAYIYVIGWKGGNLFPSFDELRRPQPPPNGVYTTKLGDADMYATLNKIYKDVLHREETLGCHTGRKTGYLFACMQGCTDTLSIMNAADHSCPKIAKTYIRDAEAIAAVNRCFNDPNQRVGTWRNPHSAGGENSVLATAQGAEHHRPLWKLAVGFIEQRVGISPAHPHHRHPKFVFDSVMRWRKPREDATRQLEFQLEHISEDRSQVIMNCVGQIVHQAVDRATRAVHAEAEKDKADWQHAFGQSLEARFAQSLEAGLVNDLQTRLTSEGGEVVDTDFIKNAISQALQTTLQKDDPFTGTLAVTPFQTGPYDAPDDGPAPKRSRVRHGTKSLPVVANIGRLPALAKLEWIDAHADENTGDYIEKSRHMLNRINKIAKCFRDCCEKDACIFLGKHGKPKGKGIEEVLDFAITKFDPRDCDTCTK